MTVKELLDWCKLPAVVLAMFAAVGIAIDARAQSAAEEKAEETVKAQMTPIQAQLGELVAQGRRKEDRDALVFCLDREHQDVSVEERKRICQAESDWRWRTWNWEDCVDVNGLDACGPKPERP